MAIDPRIALGVQPPQQQPNMLAQYAQIMGIKAAQQDIEGNDALREAYAQGGDLNDPAFRQRVMAANPKLGSQLIKTNAETGNLQNEAISNRIKLSREMLTGVNTPEDYIAWHEANHKDPVLGGYLNQRGVTAEQSRAKIIAELSKPGGLDKLKRESALGATDLQKELMQTERTRISSGPAYQQAALAQKQFDLEQADSARIASILRGEPSAAPATAVTPPVTGGGGGAAPNTLVSPAPMGGGPAPVTATPPAAGPVTQPNVLATQVAPPAAPIVNALNPNAQKPNTLDQISALIKIGKPKAIQAADALIKQYNLENPEGEIKQDASGALVTVNKRTNVATPVLGKDGKPVIGDSKYESAYTGTVGKEQAERNSKVVTSAQAASANIEKIDSAIELLKTGDATTGFGAELRNNIDRARALFADDIKAGKKVADTQILDALLGSDVFSMIQSLGIGARGLDTPAERDYLRQVMTGTIQMDKNALVRLSEIRRNIEVRAIEKYNTQLEKGELNKYFETQGLKAEKIEIPSAPGASGTMVSTPDGRNIVFPDAASAAKFRKEAGIK